MATVTAEHRQTPRELAEIGRPAMAKANLRKAETVDFRVVIGRVIARAQSLAGWSLKELAAKVERDPRQVARWLDGSERAQFDVLFAVEELRGPLVIALGELAGADVQTTVIVRRSA